MHLPLDPVPQRSTLLTNKAFIAWTILSALTVWLGLVLAEGLAIERCQNDGLAWNWRAWTCVAPHGTIIVPPGLRRAGTD